VECYVSGLRRGLHLWTIDRHDILDSLVSVGVPLTSCHVVSMALRSVCVMQSSSSCSTLTSSSDGDSTCSSACTEGAALAFGECGPSKHSVFIPR